MPLLRLSLLVLLVGLGTSVAWGQEQAAGDTDAVPDTVVSRVSAAFEEGNVKGLLDPAADRVEVTLFGTRTFYSRGQAFYVLREFFERHPPERFVIADATGSGSSCFLQGQFEHGRDEETLHVYTRFVRYEEDVWQLHEVRIDSAGE